MRIAPCRPPLWLAGLADCRVVERGKHCARTGLAQEGTMTTHQRPDRSAAAGDAPRADRTTRRGALRTAGIVAAAPAITATALPLATTLGLPGTPATVAPSLAVARAGLEAGALPAGLPAYMLAGLRSAQEIAARLGERIIWQDGAIASVASTLDRWRAAAASGTGAPDRPLASFLFLGPQGVGKMMLVKGIARVLYGSEDAILHLAIDKDAAPAPAQLEPAAHHPGRVIVLDAVEHAPAEMLTALREILSHGRLALAGTTASFQHSVVVLTTTGSARALDPDLLRHVDQHVVFNPLDREALQRALAQRRAGIR